MRREFAAETTTGQVQIGRLAAATRSRRSPSLLLLYFAAGDGDRGDGSPPHAGPRASESERRSGTVTVPHQLPRPSGLRLLLLSQY